ncbi:hypothetical protein ACU61A_40880 [Pseudonocardia sichuanensis]
MLERVEAALQTRLDRTTCVRKRRSIGVATDRRTWVRIEVRRVEKLYGQGPGVEAAAALSGIAKPAWRAAVTWLEPELELMWRVDETELVTAAPIKPGGTLTIDPQPDEAWWARLGASLDALAAASTTRVATVHTVPMTQDRLTGTISEVFQDVLDTTVTEWAPAHGDLNWANLTGPQCWLLDWEDWGMAPRGLDSASLWVNSLAVPRLAERVRRERRADLDSRSGVLASLFFCAELLSAPPGYAGPLAEPVHREAARLLTELGR